MLDWIRIPIAGGHADITFVVLGILLIAGALFARRHYERQDAERYEKALRASESRAVDEPRNADVPRDADTRRDTDTARDAEVRPGA